MEEKDDLPNNIGMEKWLKEKERLLNDEFFDIVAAVIDGKSERKEVITYYGMLRWLNEIENEVSGFFRGFLEAAMKEILLLNLYIFATIDKDPKFIEEKSKFIQELAREIYFIQANFDGMRKVRNYYIRFFRNKFCRADTPVLFIDVLPMELRKFAHYLFKKNIENDEFIRKEWDRRTV